MGLFDKKDKKPEAAELKTAFREQWDSGYEEGKKMALSLGRPVRGDDFPL